MMVGIFGNTIEGVNRSRGEAAETVHHLFIAKLRGYIEPSVCGSFATGTRSVFA
jgi:hypothetical protein